MKAIEITQYGGPEVLKLGERPMPETKAGEVLIRVRAAGVNRPDVFRPTFPDWKSRAKLSVVIWRMLTIATA